MKNILLDNRVVLCGKQWVSNLYTFNYGYRNHDMEEDNMYTDCYQEKVNGRLCNKFLNIEVVDKRKYVNSIKKYFCKSDYIPINIENKMIMRAILSSIDYNTHDTVALYYKNGTLKVCIGYTGGNTSVDLNTYEYCYIVKTDCNVTGEYLCFVCSKAFKFTCAMYNIKDIYFRIHCSEKALRIDSAEYNDFGDNIFTLIKGYDFDVNKDKHLECIDRFKTSTIFPETVELLGEEIFTQFE